MSIPEEAITHLPGHLPLLFPLSPSPVPEYESCLCSPQQIDCSEPPVEGQLSFSDFPLVTCYNSRWYVHDPCGTKKRITLGSYYIIYSRDQWTPTLKKKRTVLLVVLPPAPFYEYSSSKYMEHDHFS